MLNLKAIRDSLSLLKSEETKLRNRLEQALRRREDLYTLPLPKKDFMEQVDRLMDTVTSNYSTFLKNRLAPVFEKPLEEPNWTNFNPLISEDNRMADPFAVFHLFRKEIKTSVLATISSWEWPKVVGPSRADRIQEVAKLDAEIQNLQKQITEIQGVAA